MSRAAEQCRIYLCDDRPTMRVGFTRAVWPMCAHHGEQFVAQALAGHEVVQVRFLDEDRRVPA